MMTKEACLLSNNQQKYEPNCPKQRRGATVNRKKKWGRFCYVIVLVSFVAWNHIRTK